MAETKLQAFRGEIMRIVFLALAILIFGAIVATADETPTWDSSIETLDHRAGFIDLYLDADENKIYGALPTPDETGLSVRFIYTTGLTGGLGSNPIGLDRGNATRGIIVGFRKVGNRIIAEQENWRFRASADNPREKLAVAQSFARSILWSQDIHVERESGELLVDLTSFLTRDQFGIANSLQHGKDAGAYTLDQDRSFADLSSALAFPDNVELDAHLTFSSGKPNAQTYATAPDARSVTLILHHSFVRLPDEGYKPRKFDQRTANIGFGFYDYSSDLTQPIVQR